MSDPATPRRRLAERPLGMAALSLGLGGLATAALMFWASVDPVTVVVGKDGRHDQAGGAACLDCHVPFEGTPSSRCLGPGCHGDLATGTPPRDGPAMPVRFHVALRMHACIDCHSEHEPDVIRGFEHALIPEPARARCRACHLGEGVQAHARTDAVACDMCHGQSAWTGAPMVHERVAHQPCDLCHGRPETEAHASVAGACGDCHTSDTWTPEDLQDEAK